MTTRAQFQVRAGEMLADAQTLLDAGRAANAYYLAGYAVEMALKAVIARRFVADEVPDLKLVRALYTHRLVDLLALADLQAPMSASSAQLQANWTVASTWTEQTRYESRPPLEARDLLQSIGDPVDGVLPWLKTHW